MDKYNNKNPNFQEKAGKNAIFLELLEIILQTSKKMREKLPKCLELSKILRIFAPSNRQYV